MDAELYVVEVKDWDGRWRAVYHREALVDYRTNAEVMGEIERHYAALGWVSEVGFIRQFPAEGVSA